MDEAIESYVDWREECLAVWDAFDRWASSSSGDAGAAFSAYRAALDREECAAHTYADLVACISGGKGWKRLRRELELSHQPSASGDSRGEAA